MAIISGGHRPNFKGQRGPQRGRAAAVCESRERERERERQRETDLGVQLNRA